MTLNCTDLTVPVQNKLQSNDDKTEILLIDSAPGIALPCSVGVGQCDNAFLVQLVTSVSLLKVSSP